MSWNILEHKSVSKTCRKLPHALLIKYELWKNLVFRHGPDILKKFPGFHDEKLIGVIKGQRSSRLSNKYRVIYKVQKTTVTVCVEDITPHKYEEQRIMSKKIYEPARKYAKITTGDSIRLLRELKGWTQQELAQHANITATNISLLENNRVDIGKKRAEQLARAFGIHPAIIMFPEYEADFFENAA